MRGKTVVTGNPVRPAVLAAAATPYAPSRPGEPFQLLVFGGSQGAQFFSDAMPAAIALLPRGLRARGCVVTQQARAEDVARVKAAYAAAWRRGRGGALLHRHGGAHRRRRIS